MKTSGSGRCGIALLFTSVALCGRVAVHPAHAQEVAAVAYMPSIADLMTWAIQQRHAKLALAVRERNWTYAAYETRELRSAFARIARTIPRYEVHDTATLFMMIKPPIDDLEAAINAKSAKGATAAYVLLTETCNACHAAIKRSYIHIVSPRMSMFPNQDFSAVRGP